MGDVVRIIECRPLSQSEALELGEIVRRARAGGRGSSGGKGIGRHAEAADGEGQRPPISARRGANARILGELT